MEKTFASKKNMLVNKFAGLGKWVKIVSYFIILFIFVSFNLNYMIFS